MLLYVLTAGLREYVRKLLTVLTASFREYVRNLLAGLGVMLGSYWLC